MKNKLIPKQTLDGSYTFYNSELDENYHSLDGARSESEYVYIRNGLERFREQKEIKVFEMGFGTGLNALLSLNWAKSHNVRIIYTAIEAFPIADNDRRFLEEHDEYINKNIGIFQKLHDSNESYTTILEEFDFRLFKSRMEDYDIEDLKNGVDVVFYDAFAPSRQKDIWMDENIQKAYTLLKTNGVLTTYCASGDFKRSLKRAGFELLREKGFSKKREMFLGIKKP